MLHTLCVDRGGGKQSQPSKGGKQNEIKKLEKEIAQLKKETLALQADLNYVRSNLDPYVICRHINFKTFKMICRFLNQLWTRLTFALRI